MKTPPKTTNTPTQKSIPQKTLSREESNILTNNLYSIVFTTTSPSQSITATFNISDYLSTIQQHSSIDNYDIIELTCAISGLISLIRKRVSSHLSNTNASYKILSESKLQKTSESSKPDALNKTKKIKVSFADPSETLKSSSVTKGIWDKYSQLAESTPHQSKNDLEYFQSLNDLSKIDPEDSFSTELPRNDEDNYMDMPSNDFQQPNLELVRDGALALDTTGQLDKFSLNNRPEDYSEYGEHHSLHSLSDASNSSGNNRRKFKSKIKTLKGLEDDEIVLSTVKVQNIIKKKKAHLKPLLKIGRNELGGEEEGFPLLSGMEGLLDTALKILEKKEREERRVLEEIGREESSFIDSNVGEVGDIGDDVNGDLGGDYMGDVGEFESHVENEYRGESGGDNVRGYRGEKSGRRKEIVKRFMCLLGEIERGEVVVEQKSTYGEIVFTKGGEDE